MKNIVIYHDHCLDGTCAAWVASNYLPEEETTYIPVSYGKPLGQQIEFPQSPEQEDIARDITLYILDWCPEMVDLDKCCNSFGKVILIDHHEGAIKKLWAHYNSDAFEETRPKNLEVFLAHNNEWSGAMGTAMWFHEQFIQGHAYTISNLTNHWLVKAVDDRDRWQFKLPYTKEINEGLFFHSTDLAVWKTKRWDIDDEHYYRIIGEILLKKKQQDCESIIQSCCQIIPTIYKKVPVVNCTYQYASDIGNILAKEYPIAIMWYIDKDGAPKISLRSNSKTEAWLNCNDVAQICGGGGHANAAGINFQKGTDIGEALSAVLDAIDTTYDKQ